jgi:hypothetical protein
LQFLNAVFGFAMRAIQMVVAFQVRPVTTKHGLFLCVPPSLLVLPPSKRAPICRSTETSQLGFVFDTSYVVSAQSSQKRLQQSVVTKRLCQTDFFLGK